MEKPIDRNNRDEVLMQIGYVRATIEQLNREISYCDKEIDNWPGRKAYLEDRKEFLKGKISKKHLYVNQLESDTKTEKMKCEKCDSDCEQITGAEAEQPYKGFDSNIVLLRCKECHHEFEPV